MPNIVQMAASLDATPAEVFATYLDPRRHAKITGAPVKIAAHAGAQFTAFNGALSGRILQVVRNRLIVQSWRASSWKATDVDSTLILTLHAEDRNRTLVRLVHVNVPDHDFAGVSHGWEHYYWAPWRKYLEDRRKLRK